MKRRIISATLIAATLIGFNLSAQDTAQTNQTNTEVNTEQNIKADNKDNKRNVRRKRQRPNFFKGIDLTAEQKSQLDSLRPARRVCQQANADNTNKECCYNNFKGQKRDYAHFKKMKRQYIKKVKEILTPEQYVVFLENMVYQQRPYWGTARHNTKNGHHRHHRHHNANNPK